MLDFKKVYKKLLQKTSRCIIELGKLFFMLITNNRIEEQFEAFEASASSDVNVFESGIDVAAGKISEVVGPASENKPVGTRGAFTDDDKKGLFALLDFSSVSDRIGSMIRSSAPRVKKLPSPEKQVKLVKRSLAKEQVKLIKQAKKIQNARRFSAAKLEQVLLQVRHVQKLLKELVTAAKDQVELLYQKYVLKMT